MATNAIVEVTTQIMSTDVPRDWSVNHLAFQTDAAAADPDFQALCVALKNVWFATSGSYFHYGNNNGGKVVAYNHADPIPRPERGFIAYTPATYATGAGAPRQVALCCSFYSNRNLKRQRGRIYLPYNGLFATSNDRPSSTNLDYANALMVALNHAAAALTPSWNHCVYSTVDNAFRTITNYWCNDTWDIQRRRGLRESARHTAVP